ncbi:cell wall anchor protein [Flavonifractor plautii]|nr:cell wall anchor protein [Flavonifractor plautii]
MQVCYPTSVTRSEDGTEIRKVYDLSPEQDPAGIPRSDFEQDGFHYTLTDLLQQELPEHESRPHTETVSLESKSKDMESVLALLPQEKEFVTEDGLSGTLSLQLDTVQVEAAGYGSSTREVSATRSYPNLASQDTASIPKSIEEDGRNLTLQNIDWRTDNTASVAGYNLGDCYTAVATYTGTATSSYVTGYTVTADYTGTVSRIALNRVRYVAIFEGGAPGARRTHGGVWGWPGPVQLGGHPAPAGRGLCCGRRDWSLPVRQAAPGEQGGFGVKKLATPVPGRLPGGGPGYPGGCFRLRH